MAKFIVCQYRDAVAIYDAEIEAETAHEAWEKAEDINGWRLRGIYDQDEAMFTVRDFNTSQEIIDANGAKIDQPPCPT